MSFPGLAKEDLSPSEQVEMLQNLLVSVATGGHGDVLEYARLRQVVLDRAELKPHVPRFLRTCRDTSQFWQFIKREAATYDARRKIIWDSFRPLLDILERGGPSPSDKGVSETLTKFDPAHVHDEWTKCLDRRHSDPEGAITTARSLLETVCKHVLDETGVAYKDSDDLPSLYSATSKALKLAPSQHTEDVFKQILGGCTSVVTGLGSLRNRLSDSHGRGKEKAKVRPAPRHAELAVNLAGTMATFLVATWQAQRSESRVSGT